MFGRFREVAPTSKPARLEFRLLALGRYVGAEAHEEDGEPFDEKMKRFTTMLRAQQAEATRRDAGIAANPRKLGHG